MMMRMMMMKMISCYYYRYPKLISQIPNWVGLLFFLLFISPKTPQHPPKKKSVQQKQTLLLLEMQNQ
jgi:hypothetical protein